MKESYGESQASYPGPESCGDARKGGAEALTGVAAGQVLSREIHLLRGADALRYSGRQDPAERQGKFGETPRGQRPLACGETPCTGTGRSQGRPTKGGAASERPRGHEPTMNVSGKSDGPVVPGKRPNEAHRAEEVAEGRGPAKGNSRQQNTLRTQSRASVPSALERVREAARRGKPSVRFDAKTQGKSRMR
jgi:hypothetical protein